MNDITDVSATVLGREREVSRPGNDIDSLPDDSAANVEHTVTGILATLGESLHDRVKVALWRLNNPRDLSDQEYLSEYLPQEFTLDRVAQDFGGGYYRAVVRVPRLDKETGMPVGNVLMIAKAPRFKIGGPAKDKAAPVVLSGQPSNMDGAIKAMMDGMQNMMDRLATALQKPEKSTLEMVREFAEMKALFTPPPAPPAPPPGNPLADALTQFTLMEKIKAIFNPQTNGAPLPENPSDNAMLMQLVNTIAPAIVAAVQKDKGIVPGAPVAALPAPVPGADEPPANAAPAEAVPAVPDPGLIDESDPVNLMKQAQELMLKAFVADLVVNARANNDIEPHAQKIYEQATDEMWEFLEAPDALEKLAAIHKDVKLFPQWFEKLRARLIEIDSAHE